MEYIKSIMYSTIPFVISAIPIILLNIFLIKEKRSYTGMEFSWKEKTFIISLILSLLLVLSVTIGNNNTLNLKEIELNSINLKPFKGIYMQYIDSLQGNLYSIANLFGNIVLFIPFGFFFAAYLNEEKSKWLKYLLIIVLISFCIESIQLFCGRVADITDIILNTIGAVIGKCVFQYLSIICDNFFRDIHLKSRCNNKESKLINIVQIICWVIFFIVNLI